MRDKIVANRTWESLRVFQAGQHLVIMGERTGNHVKLRSHRFLLTNADHWEAAAEALEGAPEETKARSNWDYMELAKHIRAAIARDKDRVQK